MFVPLKAPCKKVSCMCTIKPDKKNPNFFNVTLLTILFVSFMFLLTTCRSHVIAPEPASAPLTRGKLIVLPFKNISGIYGENISHRCPLCGNVFMTGEVIDDAEDILTDRLISLMESRKGVELIPLGQAQGVWSEMLSRDKDRLPERDQIVETGSILGADLVMAG